MKVHRSKHSQHGAALMVMLVIFILGSAAFLVSSLTRIGLSMRNDQINSEVLNQAKEALIAYAVSNANRPGNLPCPDRHAPDDVNYGKASSPCSSSGKTSIGRLPWKELGIPELFDSSGQSLWYALSDNFRTTAGVINSNTSGTLSVYDPSGTLLTPSWDRAVAVVFAPGAAIGNQARSTNVAASCSTTGTTIAQFLCANNYLESSSGRNNASATGPYIAANKDTAFNDQLIYIAASQLMNNVEKRVAREMKEIFTNYYATWSAFPFAAPFTDPTGSSYSGATNTYYGLLPLNSLIEKDTNRPAWNSTPTISFSDGGHYLAYCERRDGDWNNSRWRCCKDSGCSSTATIPSGVTVTITGRLNHVGKGIWDPHNPSDTNEVRVKDENGNTVVASSILNNVAVTELLNQTDGSAIITFSAQGKSGGSKLQRIELRDITAPAASLPSWFATNNWREVMTYALSSDYAPGGTHTCTPSCITVDGQTASAVIAATGASLSTQAHPSSAWSDYMEGANASPAAGGYANGALSSSFNDKIITVAP